MPASQWTPHNIFNRSAWWPHQRDLITNCRRKRREYITHCYLPSHALWIYNLLQAFVPGYTLCFYNSHEDFNSRPQPSLASSGYPSGRQTGSCHHTWRKRNAHYTRLWLNIIHRLSEFKQLVVRSRWTCKARSRFQVKEFTQNHCHSEIIEIILSHGSLCELFDQSICYSWTMSVVRWSYQWVVDRKHLIGNYWNDWKFIGDRNCVHEFQFTDHFQLLVSEHGRGRFVGKRSRPTIVFSFSWLTTARRMPRFRFSVFPSDRQHVVLRFCSPPLLDKHWPVLGDSPAARFQNVPYEKALQNSSGLRVDFTYNLWNFTSDSEQERHVLFHSCCCWHLLFNNHLVLQFNHPKSPKTRIRDSQALAWPVTQERTIWTYGWASRDSHDSYCCRDFHSVLVSSSVPALCVCRSKFWSGLQLGKNTGFEQLFDESVDLLFSYRRIPWHLQKINKMSLETQHSVSRWDGRSGFRHYKIQRFRNTKYRLISLLMNVVLSRNNGESLRIIIYWYFRCVYIIKLYTTFSNQSVKISVFSWLLKIMW